jgi:23S rRNA (adenine2030-N6)-methyltransferase
MLTIHTNDTPKQFNQTIFMLSYRHAFHAGNHADVLKHFVLMQTLAHTAQKDKPFWYIDTHAGAGMYSLDTGYATQNAEYETGIAKLWNATDLPEPLLNYVGYIKSLNQPSNSKTAKLHLYPGSPICAQALLRADDRMRLFELHPSDFDILRENFRGEHRTVKIDMSNGFAGIKAILPPPPRRAVVLIDPPYEEKQDYNRVVEILKDSLQRFATGTYIIWYPLLQRSEPLEMVEKLKALNLQDWMNVSLSIQRPSPDGFGMYGSGLFIVNPPWTLPKTLQTVLPYLADKLALDDGASYEIDSHIS